MAELIISKADAPGTRTIDMSFSASPPPARTTPSSSAPGAKQSSPAITLDNSRPSGGSSFLQRPAPGYRPPPIAQPALRRMAPPPPQQQPHRTASPTTDPRSLRGTYQAFANTDGLDDGGLEDEDDELGGGEDGDDGGDDGFGFDEEDDLGLGDDSGEMEEEPRIPTPSPGFTSLDDEKSDIIMRLMRLAKRGFKSARSFSMQSNIEDMRLELQRQQMESSLEGAIAFQRKGLVAISGGIEFLNKRYGRQYMHLDGWSECIHDECASASWDGIFERLWMKYRSKGGQMPPELELFIGLVGSAGMFHFSQAMAKAAIPEMGKTLRENPDIMNAMMAAMASKAAAPPPQQAQSQPEPAPSQPGGRHEMQPPPGMMGGMGGMGSMFGLPPMLPTMMQMQMPTAQSRRPDHSPPPPRVEEIQPDQDDDDALSEVISEELAFSSSEDDEIKSIALPSKRDRAPPKAAAKKNVLKI